jgi:hypothetical protein
MNMEEEFDDKAKRLKINLILLPHITVDPIQTAASK